MLLFNPVIVNHLSKKEIVYEVHNGIQSCIIDSTVIATAHADSSVDFGSQLRYSGLLRNGRSLQDLPHRFNEKSFEGAL